MENSFVVMVDWIATRASASIQLGNLPGEGSHGDHAGKRYEESERSGSTN